MSYKQLLLSSILKNSHYSISAITLNTINRWCNCHLTSLSWEYYPYTMVGYNNTPTCSIKKQYKRVDTRTREILEYSRMAFVWYLLHRGTEHMFWSSYIVWDHSMSSPLMFPPVILFLHMPLRNSAVPLGERKSVAIFLRTNNWSSNEIKVVQDKCSCLQRVEPPYCQCVLWSLIPHF